MQCYSCFSASYKWLSRIDLCLTNDLAHALTNSVKYAPRNILDHSLVSANIIISPNPQHKLWKVNPFWLTIFPSSDSIPRALAEFVRFNQNKARPAVVWDALKAHLRGLLTKQINAIKTKDWENLVMDEATRAEERYIAAPSSESERRWQEAQALYQQVSTTAAENKRFFLQQKYFNEGENTGHLLAMIAKAQQSMTHIEAIQRRSDSY